MLPLPPLGLPRTAVRWPRHSAGGSAACAGRRRSRGGPGWAAARAPVCETRWLRPRPAGAPEASCSARPCSRRAGASASLGRSAARAALAGRPRSPGPAFDVAARRHRFHHLAVVGRAVLRGELAEHGVVDELGEVVRQRARHLAHAVQRAHVLVGVLVRAAHERLELRVQLELSGFVLLRLLGHARRLHRLLRHAPLRVRQRRARIQSLLAQLRREAAQVVHGSVPSAACTEGARSGCQLWKVCGGA
eukprot:scaffold38438_cov56-Phaeocystis_antarctica.AAC.1